MQDVHYSIILSRKVSFAFSLCFRNGVDEDRFPCPGIYYAENAYSCLCNKFIYTKV